MFPCFANVKPLFTHTHHKQIRCVFRIKKDNINTVLSAGLNNRFQLKKNMPTTADSQLIQNLENQLSRLCSQLDDLEECR